MYIGSDWGAHAWAEIWTGAWIGADPTTGEVGTAARYLFFGYPDDPDSFPGVVSARIAGRITLEATRIEEDGVTFDLEPSGANVKEGGEEGARWWLHVPSGVEARGLPTGWSLRAVRGTGVVQVRGPDFKATVNAQADQGRLLDDMQAERGTFAGRPALRMEQDQGTDRMWLIHSRRRLVVVQAPLKDAAKLQLLEYLLAPTVADRVTNPATTPAAPRPTKPPAEEKPPAEAKPAAEAKPTAPAKVLSADFVGTWTLDVEGSIRRDA